MKRAELSLALSEYQVEDFQEEIVKVEMLSLLQEPRNVFNRACLPAHFTSSAWVLSEDLKHVLLGKHRKLNKWIQLGGHIEDESILESALREAQEESGLCSVKLLNSNIFQIAIHEIPENPKDPGHQHFDVMFLFIADLEENLCKSTELLELAWFKLDQVASVSDEETIHKLIVKSKNLIR